jgi:hypothetical protein
MDEKLVFQLNKSEIKKRDKKSGKKSGKNSVLNNLKRISYELKLKIS